jgi:activator of HSP90 ATPase
MKIKTDNIFQITEVDATPARVYETWLDEQTHSAFTELSSRMEASVGGLCEMFDGEAKGRFLDLERNRRIVLAWRHREFPVGIYSVVHIDLERTDKGTRINFNHIGVPEDSSGWLTEAWKKIYWNRLKNYLEESVLH